MNIFKSIFSRKESEGSQSTETSTPPTDSDFEYQPPAAAEDKLTNIVYQDHGGDKGGSDSSSKLAVIKLPTLAGKRFLDLGCNAGFFCSYASSQGAAYTLGVDNSDKIIAIAKERHPDLEFRSGGWDKYPEGEFDVVICLSAIHYAKDSVRLVANIKNCLSSDGVFVLEGGLVGATKNLWTDTLIPSWREVGDKCRHLSRGFVSRHLLANFDWEIVNESISQGGDPIKRYVIHATPKVEGPSDRPMHQLCPVEFANALAISAPTIHEQQPSYHYVRSLGDEPVDRDTLGARLDSAKGFELFVTDILYALNNHNQQILLKPSASNSFTDRLTSSLEERGIRVSHA